MDIKESILKELINNISKYNVCDILQDELYIEIKNSVKAKFKDFILSDDIKNMIYKLAEEKMIKIEKDDKTIKELLPQGFENSIKVLVYNKGPEITQTVKKFINDEKFKGKIKEEIIKFTSGVNPMIAKFVNADSIYIKLISSINRYIDSPENTMNIVMTINNRIDEAAGNNISTISPYIPYEGKMSFVKAFVDMVLNFITDEIFIKSFENKIEEKMLKFNTVGELLYKLSSSTKFQ